MITSSEGGREAMIGLDGTGSLLLEGSHAVIFWKSLISGSIGREVSLRESAIFSDPASKGKGRGLGFAGFLPLGEGIVSPSLRDLSPHNHKSSL